MTRSEVRLDIKIIKYENYIKKNPKKAYGYYSLGKIYLLGKQYKKAETYFKQALSLQKDYMLAVVGLITVNIYRGKHLKAAKVYRQYIQKLAAKNIYQRRICRAISSYYLAGSFKKNQESVISSWRFMLSIKAMHQWTDTDVSKKDRPHNLVALMLQTISYLSNYEKESLPTQVIDVYLYCAKLPGLHDDMRWQLIQRLSIDLEADQNDEMISLFETIPKNGTATLTNKIFKMALKKQPFYKIRQLYEAASETRVSLSLENLWMYVKMCSEQNVWDKSVYICCSKLLSQGWIDKVIAQAINTLKAKNIVSDIAKEQQILALYGYE